MEQKKEIEKLLRERRVEEARLKLDDFVSSNPSLDSYVYAEKTYDAISDDLDFPLFKVAMLRSITLEPILPFIKVKCFKSKIKPEIYLGDYNVIDKEILDENSALYEFEPDALVVFMRLEEVCPKLVDFYLDLSAKEAENELGDVIQRLKNLVAAFRSRSEAKIILHNFELPKYPVFGIADPVHPRSQRAFFERINNALCEIAKEYSGVYVLDYERLVSIHGWKNWFDERLWLTAKAPLSRIALEALADEYVKYFRPMIGLTKKCIILDLDNTLWGGVVGEEGVEGIKLGHNPPGNAFVDFQKELLKLYNKGFILAINSKNNTGDVMEVFSKHPAMILKKEHFASIKINWDDKVKNMREIAEELNLGLDSFVFFDDNPVERELIKQQLPGVHVVDLPENPNKYPGILRELPCFEMLSFTEEDMKRGRMYGAQIQRKNLKEGCTSLEDFYNSLQTQVLIKEGDDFSIPRLAQLAQKTNQFNLTTIRYSEEDIKNFVSSNNHRVYSLELSDKFGDNGIVGEMILKEKGASWEIDTFILSCRVIGRTVETAFLAFIIEEARKRGIEKIFGAYVPTKKNLPVKDLYAQQGFSLIKGDCGKTTWELEVGNSTVEYPPWIKVLKR